MNLPPFADPTHPVPMPKSRVTGVSQHGASAPAFVFLFLVERVVTVLSRQLLTGVSLTETQACTSRLVLCLYDTHCASDVSAWHT